jgi:hypothetical protein
MLLPDVRMISDYDRTVTPYSRTVPPRVERFLLAIEWFLLTVEWFILMEEWFRLMVEWLAKHARGIIVGGFTGCQIYLVIVSHVIFLTHTPASILTAGGPPRHTSCHLNSCSITREIPAVAKAVVEYLAVAGEGTYTVCGPNVDLGTARTTTIKQER